MMHADDREHPAQSAGQPKDYSRVVMSGTLTLVVLVPVAFVVDLVAIGYGTFNLVFLPLVPVFGLAVVTLLAGLLCFAQPASVHQLVLRLSRRSNRASSPKEGGIWCFWASYCCLLVGMGMVFADWWTKLPKLAAIIVMISLVLGPAFAKDWSLQHIRRRT